ncbi:hypothetical protein A3860_02495 [Niastella vici]|uniref:Uncharacterized protein n=1 Tax=Niastella vici TaxID=1703345 RepID=A0A1V9G9B8_9BACT|nr:hypothetical protein [Niastella vici]OQP67249.1 hypothetical protein A3860_02495 [Niastella vici]
MEVFSEYHKSKETLFKRANEILKDGGIYDIIPCQAGFLMYYTLSENCRIAYTVLKGRNDEAFKFTIGNKIDPQNEIELVKGDVLYFCYQRSKKTFFYCPKALIGKREFRMEASIGFSTYGQKTAMLKEGLIESCLSCDISTYYYNLIHNYKCDGVAYRNRWREEQSDNAF